MFVCYRDEDLKLARDEGPAEDDVEPGPAVLQEVGDGPLVPSGATGAVGQQGDVSVRCQLQIRGEGYPPTVLTKETYTDSPSVTLRSRSREIKLWRVSLKGEWINPLNRLE